MTWSNQTRGHDAPVHAPPPDAIFALEPPVARRHSIATCSILARTQRRYCNSALRLSRSSPTSPTDSSKSVTSHGRMRWMATSASWQSTRRSAGNSVLDDTESAGVTLTQDIGESEVDAVVRRIAALGQVPLVHAGEWNLTPDGPLPPIH